MRKIKLLIFVPLFVAISSPAKACDLNKLFFGASAKQIVDQYNLEVLGLDEKGESMVSQMGHEVCNKLPKNSIMDFVFIDDTFVKLKIKNDSQSQELLGYLKESFGESDDKDRKKASDGKTKVAMWNKDKSSVLYTISGNEELVDITSNKHDELFEKIVKQNSKQIDEYLKANNLGKYSASYKGVKSGMSGGVGGNSNGEYDPDALEKLKDSYDKANEGWKKKNEDNPRKGR